MLPVTYCPSPSDDRKIDMDEEWRTELSEDERVDVQFSPRVHVVAAVFTLATEDVTEARGQLIQRETARTGGSGGQG